MKKFLCVFLWCLIGFGGVYWARYEPKIIGKPMPLIVWIIMPFAGPVTIATDLVFYFREYLVKKY